MAWSDERVAILKKMWLEGRSASEIAKQLGDITRNAVIGKVHRLGLSNRDINAVKTKIDTQQAKDKLKRGRPPKNKNEEKKRGRPQKTKNVSNISRNNLQEENTVSDLENAQHPLDTKVDVASAMSEETLKNLLKVEKKSKKISLMELTERTCKWPIGDPATDKFWFCGHESEPGKPYCKTHISIAFQPIAQRRSRK